MLRSSDASAAYALAFEVHSSFCDGAFTEELHLTPGLFLQPWDYEVLMDHNFIPIQAMLFQRRLFEERGGFDVELEQLEDWNLWLRFGFARQFVYVPKTTSMFRTPVDMDARRERHLKLHEAYIEAKQRAQSALSVLESSTPDWPVSADSDLHEERRGTSGSSKVNP